MVRVCLCGNASNPKVNISGCALIHLCLDHVVRIILAKMLYHHHNNSINILIFGHRLKNHGHQSHQIDHIQGKTIFFSLQKFGILFVFFFVLQWIDSNPSAAWQWNVSYSTVKSKTANITIAFICVFNEKTNHYTINSHISNFTEFI